MTADPTLTIGFVPRERYSMAAESLASLFEHTTQDFRLIVVDPAIPSRYRCEMAAVLDGRSGVEVVTSDRPLLPNASKNLVIDRCDTDYLCLVENDLLFTDGWLEHLLEACEAFPADVASPIIIEGRNGDKEHYDRKLGYIRPSATTPGKREITPLLGPRNRVSGRTQVDLVEVHCLLYRHDVLERIGSLDEELFTQDQVDHSMALWDANATVVLEPESCVYFVPPSVAPETDEMAFYRYRWDIERARASRHRIRDHWDLVDTPGDLGFVHYRNLIPELPAVRAVLERLATQAPSVVIVDNGEWFETEVTNGITALRPFPEVDGHYGGFPASDAAAVAELDRLVAAGATTIVAGWPAFWWFDHLPAWSERLGTLGRLVIDDQYLRVFELAHGTQWAKR